MELVRGTVVIPLRGKGKGRAMCVTEIFENRVALCDGKHFRLHKPKLKNPKHTAITGKRIAEESLATDRAIKKAVREA